MLLMFLLLKAKIDLNRSALALNIKENIIYG
jgi:hypothetical protein